MQYRSDWYRQTADVLMEFQDRVRGKEIRRYRLALLLRLAGWLEGFSPNARTVRCSRKKLPIC